MIKVYVSLIKKGLRTIGQVPEAIRAQVQAILNEESADE